MIRRISSGGEFEAKVGYCRAVVAGGLVFVSGTVGVREDGTVPEDVVDQTREALRIIAAALTEAGSGFDRAVRVHILLPDREDFPRCWPLLRETFGDNPPANTMFEARLVDDRFRIEIEVTALA